MMVSFQVASTLETLRTTLSLETTGLHLVVTPDNSPFLLNFRKFAAVLLPPGSTLIDGVVVRMDGSRVALVGCNDFNSPLRDEPFTVEFMGWGGDVMSDSSTICRWQNLACAS